MMSLDWEEKQLKDVLGYEQPTNYLVDSIDYNNEFDTPVLTAGKSFLLGYTDEKHGIYKDLPAIIFDDFTTAFHYVDFPFKVKSSAMKILTCDKGKNDLKFLYYLMKTLNIDTELHKRYWISRFSKLKFNRPPLKTQKRIAEILDNAAALKEKTEQLLTEYDALAQSIFLDMFGDPVMNPKGWEIKKLNDLFEITSSKRIYKNEYIDNGIPFYRTKEIVELSEGKDISNELYISKERYYEIKTKFGIPKRGDILLSAVGTIGVMWIVDTKKPFYFKDGNLIWLKTSSLNNLREKYLIKILTFLINFEKDRLAQGAAYSALTIIKLKDFKIPIAPIELQNEFADKIDLIEKQKELAKQELKESEDLFNALLQKAFKGELVN